MSGRGGGGGGIAKTSSFDNYYSASTPGFHDAFALLERGKGSASNSAVTSALEHHKPPSSPTKGGISSNRRFVPSSPIRQSQHHQRQGKSSSLHTTIDGSGAPANDNATSSILMPSFEASDDKTTTKSNSPSSAAAAPLPPPPSATKKQPATRSASPLRHPSPLSASRIMKQSIQKTWTKAKNSNHVRSRSKSGSGNYSDAVAKALGDEDAMDVIGNDDAVCVGMVVRETESQAGVEVVPTPPRPRVPQDKGTSQDNGRAGGRGRENEQQPRFRTRSPSPVRYLKSNANVHDATNNGDELESTAASSTAPSFFTGRGSRSIRAMSPARLKKGLKNRILANIPSSPRHRHGEGEYVDELPRNNEQMQKLPPMIPMYPTSDDGRNSVEEDDEGIDTMGRFGSSSSFDVMDDYEVSNEPLVNAATRGGELEPNEQDFVINTTTFNIFESKEFLRAMGGANDASLATNYIRTGDALCTKDGSQFDRALPVYYAGLGAIMSRVRKWTIDRRGDEDEGSITASPDTYHLMYEDFVEVARCLEVNVLLLAMASILLRAGNAHFQLENWETACRDYVSAQSYRSLRHKFVSGGTSRDDIQSLVGKNMKQRIILLEDVKLNGRISNNLASAQSKRQMYEEARAEYTKALQIKQKTLEAVHEVASHDNETGSSNSAESSKEMKDDELVSDIASTYHNIGLLRINCDEPKKAEKAYKQSLSLRVKKFGLDDLGVSSSLCSLGDLYFQQRRYDDAFRSYKEALRIWKFHRGNNLKTAELYYNIALVFYHKGPYSKAKVSVAECLRIRREQAGNTSLSVASALYLFGLISSSMGDFNDALEQLRESLAIRQRQLGENGSNHLSILNVRHVIGVVLSLAGECDRAMASFSAALMGRTQRLGKHHTAVAEVLQSIGVAYISVNEFSKALETLEEALRLRQSLLGPSMEVAETLNSMSLVFFSCDDTEKAVELGEKALKVLKAAVGFDHILFAKVLKNIGDYYQGMESYEDAIESYKGSLRMMTVWYGLDHMSLSEVLNEIGATQFKQGEYSVAKDSFIEVRSYFVLCSFLTLQIKVAYP